MFKKLNTLKILRLFFEEPTRAFNVREIARLVDIAPATASKVLKALVKEGILREKKERMLHLYRANIENEFYRDLKRFYTIRKMRESGFIDALNRFYLKPAIVLFGSSAFGMDTETSDYDILIVSEKTKPFPERKKFEKIFKRNLQLFIVKEIKDIKNKHLLNSMLNGITIQGSIRWT